MGSFPIADCRLPIGLRSLIWFRSLALSSLLFALCPLPLSKPSRNVILGQLLVRIGKHLLSSIHFDQLTKQEKCRHIRDARRLLHVVRNDHDRVLLLERED